MGLTCETLTQQVLREWGVKFSILLSVLISKTFIKLINDRKKRNIRQCFNSGK